LNEKRVTRLEEAASAFSAKDKQAQDFFGALAAKVTELEAAKGSLESALKAEQNEPKVVEAAVDADVAARIAVMDAQKKETQSKLTSAMDCGDFDSAKTLKADLDKLCQQRESAVQMTDEAGLASQHDLEALRARLAAAVIEHKSLVAKITDELSQMPRSFLEFDEHMKV
jgi:septal ring factor EnvC (AmiA/AmiB activator)